MAIKKKQRILYNVNNALTSPSSIVSSDNFSASSSNKGKNGERRETNEKETIT